MDSNQIKILCIDDEPIIIKSLQAYLTDKGFSISTAPDGKSGLEEYERFQPDIVIVDLMMPVMSGFEVLSVISKKNDEAGLIVLSGTGEMKNVVKALQCGAWDYLFKPIEDMAVLVHTINNTYEKVQLKKQNKKYKENLEGIVKQRTNELFESEEKFRKAFDSAALGMALVGLDMSIIDVNDYVIQMLGYSKNEILKKSLLKITHPEEIEKSKKVYKELFSENKDKFWYEKRYLTKDKKIKWGFVSGSIVTDAENNPRMVVAHIQDITEKKEAQDALQRSEQQLNSILKNIPDIIYRLDPNGIITFISDSVKLLGYERTELIGKHIMNLIHFDDREKAAYSINERRTGNRKTYSLELRLIKKSGMDDDGKELSEKFFQIDAEGFYTECGNNEITFIGTQGIAKDISQRKYDEQRLNYRLEMEELISQISSRFIKSDTVQINSEILHALERTGRFTRVDRCYLYQYSDDYKFFILSHEWTEDAMTPLKNSMKLLPVAMAPWINSAVLRNETAVFSGEDAARYDLSESERDMFEKENIQSFCLIPMKTGEDFFGFLGYDTTSRCKKWNDDDKRLLKLISEIISNALKHKQMERELRSEMLFNKRIIQASPAFFVTLDSTFKIFLINDAMLSASGYSYEEIIGRPFNSKFVKKEHQDDFLATMVELRSGDVILKREVNLLTKSGNVLTVDWRARTILNDSGEIQYYMGMGVDITEKKANEEKLKKSEELFRLLAENAQDLIFRLQFKPDLHVQFVSPSVELITGYSPAELYEESDLILKIFHPEHKELLQNFLYGKKKEVSGVFKWLRKSGEQIWVELKSVPIYDEMKNAIAIEGIARDITKNKKMELILDQERTKLERMLKNEVLRSSIAGILNRSDDLGTIFRNVIELIGEQMNSTVSGFIGEDSILEEKYSIFIETEKNSSDKEAVNISEIKNVLGNIMSDNNREGVFSVEEIGKCVDVQSLKAFQKREIRSVCAHNVRVSKEIGGILFTCSTEEMKWLNETAEFCKTITGLMQNAWERHHHFIARLNAEQKHTEAVKTAEQAMRLASLGTLAAGITHEINQPLNALKVTVDGMLYWSKRNHDMSPEEMLKKLDFVSSQAQRINNIISQMRGLTRKDKDTEIDRQDINHIISSTLSLINRQIHVHNIELKLKLSRSLPLVMCNKTQFEQIVINLITNAIQALNKANAELKKITVKTSVQDRFVKLEVLDTGTGIPKDNLIKIYDPFFTTKSKEMGMGFGLSIVRNLLSAMDGSISVKNRKRGGAHFTVKIPINCKKNQV